MPNVRRRRLPLVCLDFVAIILVLALSMSSNFQVFSKVNAFRSHRRIRIPAWAKAILVKMFIAMNKNKTCKSIWKLLSNEFKYMLYRNVLMPVFAPNAVCLDAIRWVVFFLPLPYIFHHMEWTHIKSWLVVVKANRISILCGFRCGVYIHTYILCWIICDSANAYNHFAINKQLTSNLYSSKLFSWIY